ncbi:hypothetical protein IF2G_01779 [Cordyceps javanica]|nr:hypothetical protein IF2G_01779 [Cordyceps javanica]
MPVVSENIWRIVSHRPENSSQSCLQKRTTPGNCPSPVPQSPLALDGQRGYRFHRQRCPGLVGTSSARSGSNLGIRYLNINHVTCLSKGDDFGRNEPGRQLLLGRRHAQVIPQPAGDGPHDAVHDVSPCIRVERLTKFGIELPNHLPKLLLRNASRVQYFGVQVRKGRCQVAVEEPVASHPDDSCRGVFYRVHRHVGVEVRVAWMARTPFLSKVGLDIIAHDGRVGRRKSGADAVTGRCIGKARGILVAAALQVSGKSVARAIGSCHGCQSVFCFLLNLAQRRLPKQRWYFGDWLIRSMGRLFGSTRRRLQLTTTKKE